LNDPRGTDGNDKTNPKIYPGPPPVYESTGDQATTDVGTVGKEAFDVITDSPEFKKLTKPLTAPLEKGFEENKVPLIVFGIISGVPILTYLIAVDQKLELPIVGEKRSRELGIKAASGLANLVLGKLTNDKAEIEVKNEKEGEYQAKASVKAGNGYTFIGGFTIGEQNKFDFGIRQTLALDPNFGRGTITFGGTGSLATDRNFSASFDVAARFSTKLGPVEVGTSLFLNKEAPKPGLAFPDKKDESRVDTLVSPQFSGNGVKFGLTGRF
jgi:hypothetical protein